MIFLVYRHVQRKRKEQTILSERKEKCVKLLCHSDKILSIDSNSRRIIYVTNSDTPEKHDEQIWVFFTCGEQYNIFLESEVFE